MTPDAAPLAQQGRNSPEAIAGHVDTWKIVDPASRKYAGFHAWDLLLVLNLLLVAYFLGSTFLAGPADPNQEFPVQDSGAVRTLVHVSNFLSFALFGGLPILWLLVTRVEPVEGTLRWLKIKRDGSRTWPFWFGIASLLAVFLFFAAIAFGALLSNAEVEAGDPIFEFILGHADWFVVAGIALSAGIGEEIMFRGVLQRKLGWAGQAVLFGAAHVNQGYEAAIFIMLLSMSFGYLVKRGAPLWSVIFTHIMYDFILLGLGKLSIS
jgi:membrane protease YdiL (CAAX protease family)